MAGIPYEHEAWILPGGTFAAFRLSQTDSYECAEWSAQLHQTAEPLTMAALAVCLPPRRI